jgi:hypothetical protein
MVIYTLTQQKKRHGSAWRIPKDTNLGQRLKAAIYVAIFSLALLGVAFSYFLGEVVFMEFYEDALIEIFATGPGFWIFASGTYFTLYWARLVHSGSELGGSAERPEEALS